LSHNETLEKLEDFEKNVDKKAVDQLQQLVLVYEGLKEKEQLYKKSCKEELVKLEAELEKLKSSTTDASEENEKYEKVSEQYEAVKTKLATLKLKIAKKNREISTLKRKLDELPSRSELNQYQKRFIELYNQSITFFKIFTNICMWCFPINGKESCLIYYVIAILH
jgi:predicted RNase H-like nuclease (RuvC/YqgF family)